VHIFIGIVAVAICRDVAGWGGSCKFCISCQSIPVAISITVVGYLYAFVD
jgi:hypothetical protein